MHLAKPEFNLSAFSGLIAGTQTANSTFFAWRNPPTTSNGDPNNLYQRLKMLVVKCRTVTGFTAAQEISLAAYHVSQFGSPSQADFTGGTDLSNQSAGTDAIRRLGPDVASGPKQVSVLQSGNVRIATTTALTPPSGTVSIASHPFLWDGYFELAAAATVQEGSFTAVWTPSPEGSIGHKGLLLAPGRGFVIQNPVALGAAGSLRMNVEAFFEEA
jgi:hypothetical protein